MANATSGAEKKKILESIAQLEAGGSTPGEGGIRAAYRLAKSNFIKGGTNRVILAQTGILMWASSQKKNSTNSSTATAPQKFISLVWVSAWGIIRIQNWKYWPARVKEILHTWTMKKKPKKF